ncbi:MAG: chemotaxis protein CheA [Phenylobacterium sp.]|uniref:chemotaxis protein CheA n=1 Tax=Phenylobacterium sp. TaxID=1871053 RepID=UPI00391CDA97
MSAADPAEVFRQEAKDLLEQLEQILLDLARAPEDRTLIDGAFRALHTIKGSGAMFGFEAVAAFVHEFETAFDQVRKGRASAGEALISVALQAKDHVHALIFQPGEDAGDGAAIVAALEAIVRPGAAKTPATAAEGAPALASGAPWRLRFRLPADALASGANPLLLLDELRELGAFEVTALTETLPPLEDLDPQQLHLAWTARLPAEVDRAAVEDVFMFLRDEMEFALEPEAELAPPPAAAALEAPAAEARAPGKGGGSMRVPAERLDELMDRVGELVIAQARLSQIAEAGADPALKAIAEELERLSSGLRDTTMGIRMVPIGSLFGRFRRLVHDLSASLEKKVEFVTSGEETELDKTVVERLADPLVHLIRNAVDHGLETPEGRAAAGKPAAGSVRLSAVHAGAEVAISISDDGRGLDAARIRAKAEEAGLLSPEAKLSDSELYQFLFHPGFSTASQITSVSGRGVGMDVVKRTVESLRGSIDIATRPGGGTTATLRLPLTLAIIDGMLVRVGSGRYAIPLSAVEECVELPPQADAPEAGRSFLNIRGALVPFLRLRELLKVDAPPEPHQKVVIVSSGELRVGLVVDQIIGNSQTVIKSLSKLHAGVETFSGATILGDGTVALILDVAHLVAFGQAFEERLTAHRLGRAA